MTIGVLAGHRAGRLPVGWFHNYSITSRVSIEARSVFTQRGWGHLPGRPATGLQIPWTGQRWMVKARERQKRRRMGDVDSFFILNPSYPYIP